MHKVTARQNGDMVTISLPDSLMIKSGQEFYVHEGRNGYLALIPEIKETNYLDEIISSPN